MELPRVSARLQQFAPPSLAGSWDNTGLLVEPSAPHIVKKLLLTNDLTDPVMEEALQEKVDMILSYHPPIFQKLKRLTQASWKERLVVKCIENRIAVYSPHTSCDALNGGVNDWLLKPFAGTSEPIQRSECNGPPYRIEVTASAEQSADVAKNVQKCSGVKVTSVTKIEGNAVRISARSSEPGLHKVISYLETIDGLKDTLELSRLEKVPFSDRGPGRILKLDSPLPLATIVQMVKDHLKLPHVRLATGVGITKDCLMKKLAVCAGSGSSILNGVSADVYITGEMSHHEVLDANHRGRCVILCDHSNTERGYLSDVLQQQLTQLLEENVQILVSKTDRDPLTVV